MQYLVNVLTKTLPYNALWNKSNGSYVIKEFGTLPLILFTSWYFRWKFRPCPSFFSMQIFQINELDQIFGINRSARLNWGIGLRNPWHFDLRDKERRRKRRKIFGEGKHLLMEKKNEIFCIFLHILHFFAYFDLIWYFCTIHILIWFDIFVLYIFCVFPNICINWH